MRFHRGRPRVLYALGVALLVGAIVPGIASAGRVPTGPQATVADAASSRKLALGVSMQPYDLGHLDAFTDDSGRAPAIWSIWSNWGGDNAAFPRPLMNGLRNRGVVPMVIWQPVDPARATSPVYTYRKIAAGNFDTYIRDWATAAKAWGGMVIVRFAHEMDGNWFPWGVDRFDNTPARFNAAWRHVWDIFRGPGGVGATNVKFLWSPLAPDASFYPGGGYVDYVGMTSFNWGPPNAWKSMLTGLRGRTARLDQIAPGKPVIIAETGSAPSGGDKAAWIADGYASVYANLPSIKAIVYFNVDMRDSKQPDWRLRSPAAAMAAYRDLLSTAKFQGAMTSPSVALQLPPATSNRTFSLTVNTTDAGGAGIAGYFLSNSPATPDRDAPGWLMSRPTSFTVPAGDGAKNVYAWVKDVNGVVSPRESGLLVLDTVQPTMPTLYLPPGAAHRTIGVTLGGSTDPGSGIAGWYLSENSTTPPAKAPGWSPSKPTSFQLSLGNETKTVYAWTKDTAGNRSPRAQDSIPLNIAPPAVSLSLPTYSASTAVDAAITTSDPGGTGIDGYFLSDDPAAPLADDPGWLDSEPTSVNVSDIDGLKRAYIWVKDLNGTVSTRDSATTLLDTVAPGVSLSGTPGTTTHRDANIDLSGSDGGSGIAMYYLSQDPARPDIDDPGWRPTAPASLSLTLGNGAKTVYAWTMDRAGNRSARTSAAITMALAAPTVSLTLRNPTNLVNVPLSLTATDPGATGITGWFLSTSNVAPGINNPGWVLPRPTTFALSGADGTKTIFAWVKDRNGSISVRDVATTLLDTTVPTVTLGAPAQSPIRNIGVTMTGADGGSGIAGYYISSDPTLPAAAAPGWTISPATSFLLSPSDGSKITYGWTKDLAGNVSARKSKTTLLDVTDPTVAITTPTASATRNIALTVTANDGGAGVAEYFVSEGDGTTPSPGDPGWTATVPTTFQLSAADGTKTLYIWARDAVGNVSARASDTVVLDRTLPTAVLIAPTISRMLSVPVTASGADGSGTGVAGYFVSESATKPLKTDPGWNASASSTFTLSTADGTKTLYAYTKDAVGNVSDASPVQTLLLDRTAPTASLTAPATTSTRLIGVSFTGGDGSGSGVVRYILSENSASPTINDARWATSAAADHTFGSDGAKTLYAWTKDAAGNISAVSSKAVSVDSTPPTAALAAITNPTTSQTVTINLSGSSDGAGGSGIVGYFLSESPTAPAAGDPGWVAVASATSFLLSPADGAKTVYAWAKDAYGNVSTSVNRLTLLDRDAPSASLAVPPATNSLTITVVVTGSDGAGTGVTGYLVTRSITTPLVSDPGWLTTGTTTVTFVGGDGAKIMYGWTKDAAGHVSASDQKTTILDRVAPTASLTAPSTSNSLTIIGITLSGTDARSGVTYYLVTETNVTPAASDSGWQSTAPTLHTVGSDGSKTLYGWTKDAAGNVSPSSSKPVSVDSTPPSVSLAPLTNPTGSQTITVALGGSDGVGVGITGYYLSESVTQPGASDLGWAANPTSFPLSSGDGTKTVYAWAKDAYGNVSASPAIRTTVLDTTAPTATLGPLPAGTASQTINVSVSGIDGGSGIAYYFLSEASTLPVSPVWLSSIPTQFRLSAGEGPKTVRLWTKDTAGNVSTPASRTTTFDTTAPTATLGILPVGTASQTINVSVSGTDGGSGISGYFLSESSTLPVTPGWLSSVPAQFTLSAGEGPKTVQLWTKDHANNVSLPTTQSTTFDATSPTASIDALAPGTATQTINIGVSGTDGGSGLAGYFLSESSTLPVSPVWLSTTPTQFTLSAGEGQKTVYLWTKDHADNVSVPDSKQTFYDITVPTVTITSDTTSTTQDVTVTVVGDDGTGSGVTGYLLSESSTPPTAGDTGWVSTAPGTFTLSGGPGSYTIWAWTKDAAGNVSPGQSAPVDYAP